MHHWPLDGWDGMSADLIGPREGSVLGNSRIIGSVRRPSDPCRGAIRTCQEE